MVYTVYKALHSYSVTMFNDGQRLGGNTYSVPQAPNWCGPYFMRPLPVLAYLGETHDTAVGSPKEAAQNS